MIVAPKPLVCVQSKSTKGKCQSNNQTAYTLDDCGSETSSFCPVTVNQRGVPEQQSNGLCSGWLWLRNLWCVSSQSQPKESVRATTKRPTLWMIVAPKPLVSVQSKPTKGKCQSNNQTAYALDSWGSETSGVCPVTVVDVLLAVNNSPAGITTQHVLYLYFSASADITKSTCLTSNS